MSVLVILSPIFSICNVVLILSAFFGVQFKITKYKLLLLLFLYMLLLVTQIFHNTLLFLTLNILFIIIFLLVIVIKLEYKVFLLVLIALVVEALLEGLLEITVTYFVGNISMIIDFVLRIFTLLIFLGIFYFNKRKKYLITMSKENVRFITSVAVIGIIIGIIPLALMQTMNIQWVNDNSAILLICIIIIIISIIHITTYYIKQGVENSHYQKEIVLKEQVIALQEENIDQTVNNYQNLRLFKHDIRSYLQTIEVLIEHHNYDELKKYTHELSQKIKPTLFTECSDIYILYILQMFEEEILDEKYILEFNYDIIGKIKMKDTHKSSLFYNLLKNATEELRRIPKCEQRKLVINVGTINGSLIIEIENSVESDKSIKVIMANTTSKIDKENHGLGLFSVKKIIEDYDGEIEYKIKEDSLVMSIYIMDVVENG